MAQGQHVLEALRSKETAILSDWVALQLKALTARPDLVSDQQLREQSRNVLRGFAEAAASEGLSNIAGSAWAPVREVLQAVAHERAKQGFSPRETAMFVMSLKQPLARELRTRVKDGDALADEIWLLTEVLDQLALYTTEVYQKGREEVIAHQQMEMLELSTPVITLWKGVLALPLIGTLDSERTQTVMQTLLQRIVETGSTIAILDITGVPTVDTLVAQHLLKTVAAARLMGADCIISGIRPQIAQTIVHLGIDLNTVATKATLAEAFAVALDRQGLAVVRKRPRAARPSSDD
jgi:rsbT co-antagonist protein RsbR